MFVNNINALYRPQSTCCTSISNHCRKVKVHWQIRRSLQAVVRPPLV